MLRLKQVDLIFENCEHLLIPGKYIRGLYIGDITRCGHGSNLWYSAHHGNSHDGWYSETDHSRNIEIKIVKDFLESKFVSFGDVEDYSKYQRLMMWKDITWVRITNKEYGVYFFINPIKYIFNFLKSCLLFVLADYSKIESDHKISLHEKWQYYNKYHSIRQSSSSKVSLRKKDRSYSYSTPWYYDEKTFIDANDGKEYSTECSNKWQRVESVDDGDGPYITIIIKEQKDDS